MTRFDMHVLNALKFTCVVLIGVVVSAIPNEITSVEVQHPPKQHNVIVGESVVLDCNLDFPQNYAIPYCLTWNKDNNTIYRTCDDTEPTFENAEFENRITRVDDSEYGNGSINITDVQTTDRGWYECHVVFRNRSPPSRNKGTLYYLEIELGTTVSEEEDFTEISTDSTTITMEVMASMGPPRDLSIHITSEGYLLRWTPPKHGVDLLRVYVVRLFKGPMKYLVSSMETNQTYYLVKDLEEDEIYNFEVGSLSKNDYDAKSNMVSIHVPAYGAIRIAVAGVGCVILLILIGAIIWYKKFKMHKVTKKEDISNENKRNGNSVY